MVIMFNYGWSKGSSLTPTNSYRSEFSGVFWLFMEAEYEAGREMFLIFDGISALTTSRKKS